jgi:hypothetical protein
MGVLGWRVLSDEETLVGKVQTLEQADDKDWCMKVQPDSESDYFLENASGVANSDGQVECEVEPPNSVKFAAEHFCRGFVGNTIRIVGVFVEDLSHSNKTEIHPIVSMEMAIPGGDVNRVAFRIMVVSDSSHSSIADPLRPTAVPYNNMSRNGYFWLSFPVGCVRPDFSVSDEVDMAEAKSFLPVKKGDRWYLDVQIESGVEAQGNGFYCARLDLFSR